MRSSSEEQPTGESEKEKVVHLAQCLFDTVGGGFPLTKWKCTEWNGSWGVGRVGFCGCLEQVVGSVFLVRAKSDGKAYALKQIRVNRDDIVGSGGFSRTGCRGRDHGIPREHHQQGASSGLQRQHQAVLCQHEGFA